MKRINPRRAKLHRSYDVGQLADVLGVHKGTVRNWLKAGLPAADGSRPILIHGDEFQAWWAEKRKAAKCPCKPGQLYCFKCRDPRRPAEGMVDYTAKNAISGDLTAMCETCGTIMHRRAQLASLSSIFPNLEVRHTVADPRIRERASPSLNCDKMAGA